MSDINPQAKDQAEAVTLAKFMGVSEFAMKALCAAWDFHERKIPATTRNLAMRFNARLNTMIGIRVELEAMRLWPPYLPGVQRDEEATDPIRAMQVSAQQDEKRFRALSEVDISAVARIVKEYDRVWKSLHAFKAPHKSAAEQILASAGRQPERIKHSAGRCPA